jgi:hypothetical protein
MTALDSRRLGDALRASACGIHPLEAGTSISDGVTLLASIDWEAAVTALHAGELPASGGERRMLLLAASIAGTPVSLCETLPGIDQRNASLAVRAVAHAAGLSSD